MNRQSVLKTELFISGLKERYKENESIFSEVYGEYISGTASYKFFLKDGKLNFNKETIDGDFVFLIDLLISKANLYDGLKLYYSDRISTIEIIADNGRVTSKTTDTAGESGVSRGTEENNIISPKKSRNAS